MTSRRRLTPARQQPKSWRPRLRPVRRRPSRPIRRRPPCRRRRGRWASASTSTRARRVVLPGRDRGQMARPAARPRHRQHPVPDREPGRLRQLRQALLRPLRHRGLGPGRGRRGDRPVLSHDYDARGRDVLIQFPIGTLGDILAWFPYAARFAEVHGCRLTCAMSRPASFRCCATPIRRSASSRMRSWSSRSWRRRSTPPTASACSSTMRIASTSRPISAMSGCTAPPATSSASIRRRKRRGWCCRTRAGRSPSRMSASRCRARRRARSGTTRMAGGEVVRVPQGHAATG